MLYKKSVTVFGALLAAAMLTLVAVPADAKNYDRKYTRAEKKEFRHWLRAQNHDWRRWMHEQKYEWWKWVHEQKHLFYQGEWDRDAEFAFPGSDNGNNGGGDVPPANDPPASEPPATEPKPRFEMVAEYGDLAVRDNSTGLVWEKNPNTGTVNFYAAWMTCARKDLNRQMGWRLPAAAELTSLIDGLNSDAAANLLLPAGHPFGGIFADNVTGYWSATQSKTTSGVNVEPLAVYFSYNAAGQGANLPNTVGKLPYFNTAGVWCVSGGLMGPSVTD